MKARFNIEKFRKLSTEHLVLRKIYEEDTRDIYENIYKDYDWHKYAFPERVGSISECHTLMRKQLYRFGCGEHLVWGVTEKHRDKVIGIVSLFALDNGKNCCKMGCMMSCNHAGKGYAKEAASKVMNFAFRELNIRKIQIEIVSENVPSLRLAKKLKMQYESTKEGSYRLGDVVLDERVFFKLNPNCFPKRKKK
ncbi:MAG: GNAT family N-acetyltransferase [Bacilli bacterium]|nr:GNAT family N-acetyltransferase [Bacilli bacterium]